MIATDFTEALHEMLIGFRYVRCVLVFYVYCTSACDLRKLYRICSFGNIPMSPVLYKCYAGKCSNTGILSSIEASYQACTFKVM